MVEDRSAHTCREIGSTSGGEKFQIAMSLALGLSDTVQAHTSTIKIDTMFIDEGFSTLDMDSLHRMLDVLKNLSGGHRQIGIISHVDKLEEIIQNKYIRVRKIPGEGSALKQECCPCTRQPVCDTMEQTKTEITLSRRPESPDERGKAGVLKMAGNKAMIDEYRRVIPYYRRIEPIAMNIIREFAEENHFFLMTVQSRIKKESSFAEKIVRKNDSIRSIDDVTDLLGIRIICYFSDDVDLVARGLLDRFIIDRDNSVDKRKGLSAREFGYMAVHGIFSLKPELNVPEELLGHKFEIQIKTVLQHAWAEIEHDLGYKSEFGIPAEIRRRFSMTASLMELGDQEFVTLRDSARNYAAGVQKRIAEDDVGGIMINAVSLRKFMEINERMLRLYKRIMDECGVEIMQVDCGKYIEQLARMDIVTLDRLETEIARSEDSLIGMIREQLGGLDLDVAADSTLLKMLLRLIAK